MNNIVVFYSAKAALRWLFAISYKLCVSKMCRTFRDVLEIVLIKFSFLRLLSLSNTIYNFILSELKYFNSSYLLGKAADQKVFSIEAKISELETLKNMLRKTIDSCLNSYCEKKENENCQLLNQISLDA
jgi:hypothetical protein